MKRLTIALLTLPLLAPVAALADSNLWFHVRVQENGGANIRVNLPLGAIETALSMIDDEDLSGGKVRFNDTDLTASELRALWQELKSTPEDVAFVTIEDGDEEVRLVREGGYLLAKVRESQDHGDHVDVKIPEAVVDAMLSAGGDELDIAAGLRALAEHGAGDLVTVQGDDETVRVWIDKSAEAR